MRIRFTVLVGWCGASLAAALAIGAAVRHGQGSGRPVPPVQLTPYKMYGTYKLGEWAGWTVTMPYGSPAPTGLFPYTLKENNFKVIQAGKLDLSSGKATIQATLAKPAMLYLEVHSPDPGGGVAVAGAAVDPTELKPTARCPRDFDRFWNSKIRALERVKINPHVTPKDSGNPNVDYATVRLDQVNGVHVYGQIAKPKRAGKFPALLILQWASPPYPLQRAWVTDHAAQGWLTLNIEPHDVLPDAPQSYYDALPQSLKNYAAIGRDDRDACYFLQMYLADYRAVDYLASRPDWDGDTLVVMGTSMGGQQSLCVAGLNPKVTDVLVEESSGCDTNGPVHGRQSGYPNFPANDPKAMETALYFDAVNFASRIRAKTLVSMGFVDTVAPAAGIWTAFNQIRAPKEVAPMVDAPHNNTATFQQQRPWFDQSSAWLDALVHGRKLNLRPSN